MTVSPIAPGQFADLWGRLFMVARGLQSLLTQVRSHTRTPTFQVLLAVGGMLGGAAVIGRVAFGITLMVGSLLVGVDGLLRQEPEQRRVPTSHEDVLERYRRAR